MLIVHLFVSYAYVNLCHFVSSTWCRGLAATSSCGLSDFSIYLFTPPSLSQQSDCMLYLEFTTDIVVSCAGRITSPRIWISSGYFYIN